MVIYLFVKSNNWWGMRKLLIKYVISQDLSDLLALLYYKAHSYILCLYSSSYNSSLFTAPLEN